MPSVGILHIAVGVGNTTVYEQRRVYKLTDECQPGYHVWRPHAEQKDPCLCGKQVMRVTYSGFIKNCPKMLTGDCHCME